MNTLKDKNHTIISVDVLKKALKELQHPFMIRIPQRNNEQKEHTSV